MTKTVHQLFIQRIHKMKTFQEYLDESLWDNIHKKRERIKKGSGEKMRKKGADGAPTPDQMKRAQATSESSMSDQQDKATKAYNDNKKTLQSLHRKTKTKGGHVAVTHTNQKGKSVTGKFGGMMRMGAHTYAKVHHKNNMTLLPLHEPTKIQHIT